MANEQRLIDANALDEKLEILKVRFKAQGRNTVAEDYNFVQTVLMTAPTVDAVEVVHGRWIYEPLEFTYEKDIKCSKCGRYVEHATNYCPHCGAKMDGGNEDG